MSTQLTVFTDDQIDVIYKATHLTETLNKKLATALPAGIYQGFNLVVNGTTDLVGVDPDAGATGHVAVIENDTDRSITVRNAGGAFTLDLSSLRDAVTTKKYAIAIWGQYSKGSNTGAAIRAYETYPTNELLTAPEASTLAIMGEVEVAAGAVPALIPAAAITQARRVSAWQNLAPEHGFWKPLLQNGNFEVADTTPGLTHTTYGWRLSDGNSFLSASVADSRTGSKCLNWTAVSLSSLIFTADQYIGEPVTPTAQIRVRGFYKILQVPTAGEIEVVLTFADSTGATGSHDVRYVIMDSNSVVSAVWEEFGAVVAPPAGASQLVSFHLECDDTVMDVPSATHIARFDDWQVWKSWNGAEQQNAGRVGDMADISPRALLFPNGAYNDRATAPLMQRSVSNLLSQKTIDVATGNLRARRSLGVGDDLVQSLSEAATARLVLPHKATNQTVDGDTFTLLLESLPDTGTESSTRYYADDLGNLFFTHNAKYTSEGVWTRDDSDLEAIRFQISSKTGMEVSFREADTTSTFASSAWRSYLNLQRSHALAETEWVDFASLWEVQDDNLTQTSPYTGTLSGDGGSGDGSTGWVRIGSHFTESDEFGTFAPGTLAHVETAGREGWYVVKALGGDQGNMQVQLADIATNTGVNFGTVGSFTIRFYHGAYLGSPWTSGARGLFIQTDEDDTDDVISVQKGGTNSATVFSVNPAGHAVAPAFKPPSQPIPITLLYPGNADWSLTNITSGIMSWSSAGGSDVLVGTLPLVGSGVQITGVHVRVDPASTGNMTLTVRNYSGTSLGTDDSGGLGTPQVLSVTGLTETPSISSPARFYITSGQAGDLVQYVYVTLA